MLVKEYRIEVKGYDHKIINVIQCKVKPSEETIEDILLKDKNNYAYCNVFESYRLHSNTIYNND